MTAQFHDVYSESLASRLLGRDIIAITTADGSDQPNVILELRVGSQAGDVKVTTLNGTTVVVPNMQIGERISVPIARVWTTGTVATGLTGVI